MIFEQEWKGRNCREGDYFPVSVPGNIQYDFAIAKGFKDLSYSDNYKQFIPYENDAWEYVTRLKYNTNDGERVFFVSEGIDYKYDILLNGKNISFANVFVLFSNATTYEKSNGTELVMDTTSGGAGYYISRGYMTEIRWSVDENGALEFKTLKGEKLTVNKGNAYISYYKASNSSKVTVA